jgi:hypothetical protein
MQFRTSIFPTDEWDFAGARHWTISYSRQKVSKVSDMNADPGSKYRHQRLIPVHFLESYNALVASTVEVSMTGIT